MHLYVCVYTCICAYLACETHTQDNHILSLSIKYVYLYALEPICIYTFESILVHVRI